VKEITNKGARPDWQLTTQRSNTQSDHGGRHAERAAGNTLAEADAFYPAFWEKLIDKSSVSPSGEDPAFWPIYLLRECESLISNRNYIQSLPKADFAAKLTPIKESLQKVAIAYSIAAYPQCRDWGRRDDIKWELRADRQHRSRDSVHLDDTELALVQQLCETPRYALHRDTETLQAPIPFDPQKRTYDYSEVLNPSTSQTPVPAGK
jgi:hypothetical protein